MNTSKALIDVHERKLTLRVDDEKVDFIMPKLMNHPLDDESCMKIIANDECVQKVNFTLDVSGGDKILSNTTRKQKNSDGNL